MLKIYPLDYYRLGNAEHLALMDFVESSFESYPLVTETFSKAVELFLDAVKEEQHAMRHVGRPLQSAEIHAADLERVRYFRMLRDWAKLMMKNDDATIVKAATTIVDFSDAFGGSGIGSLSTEARTANLTIFIQRLERDYNNELLTLNLQPIFELLKEANHHFQESYMERTATDAEFGLRATRRARQSCDFALKTLFSLVQDKFRLGEGDDFEDFVKFLNVEIDKYRISLGQGPGGRKPRRKKEKADEEKADEE